MSDDTPTCSQCSRPTGHDGARLCAGCLQQVLDDLSQVDGAFKDLLITRTKQDVISREPSVSQTRERPLGYRPGAHTAAEELTICLRFWTRVLGEEFGQRFPAGPTAGLRCAAWLIRHASLIRYSNHAADLANQIRYAVAKARNVCDRPPERRYAGACPRCATDMYVREQATHIICPGCQQTYRADQRWADLLTELRDRIATAAEIAAGVGRLHGETLNRKTINQWHTRGRLIARAHTIEGHPMFRIGDVLDLARRTPREKSRRGPGTRPHAVSPCTC
jgi:hypothetical protein